MPDLSWLWSTADRAVISSVALACLTAVAGITGWALAVRLAAPAVRARRFVGRWLVLAARYLARRWDARWQGCSRCEHCLAKRRTEARARWAEQTAAARLAPGTYYIPARTTPGDRP
jgi:hypothetical protein